MIKAKVLKVKHITSKNTGKEYTSLTVMFDNNEVGNCFNEGNLSTKQGDVVELEPYVFGQNLSISLRVKF